MLNDFQASFKAVLDTSEISKQITDLQNSIKKTGTLKLKLDFENSSIDVRTINNLLSRNFSNIGTNAGQSFAKSISSSLNKIHLVNGSIGNVKNMLQGAGFDKKSINSITQDLNKMVLTINKINASQLSNGNIKMTISGVDELGRAVNIVRTFDKETGNVINTTKSFSQSFSKTVKGISDSAKATLSNIRLKIDTGDFQYKIDSVKTSLSSLENGSESASRNIALLEAALKTMNSSTATPTEKIQAYREFNSILSTTRTQLSEAKKAEREFNQEAKATAKATETLAKSATLSNNIQAWMNQNTAATDKFGDTLRELQAQLQDNRDPALLKNVSLRFAEIKSEAKKLGLTVRSSLSSVADIGKQLLGLTSTLAVIQKAIQLAKEMYQNVYDIDTAMVNLKKVTDETDTAYSQFLTRSAKSAKALGSTVSDLITETSEWAKLGYSLSEAEELSKLSSIYMNVGEVSAETAVSDMITAIKAFEIETSDVVHIIDVYNELGNNFAISSAKLGEGISNSASALALAGADLEQASAMITGIAEITQDAPEAGNALKVFSMRIRGMKGELEELGEEVDDNIESISKVQTQILNLTKGKVNIFDDSGEFRNYYEIMKDIADVYDDLTSTEQASLSEILFGKQRGNAGAALIQTFQNGQIEKAYQSAVGSMGSAYAEQEKWMDSLEAKTKQFEAAWQELSVTIMNSDFLKGLVDAGTDILSVLNDIIDTFGTIPTLAMAIATAMSFKNIGKDKKFSFRIIENMPMVMLFPLDIMVFDVTLNEIH